MAGGTARRSVGGAIRLCLLLGAAIFGSCDGLKRGRLTIDTGGRAPFPAFHFSLTVRAAFHPLLVLVILSMVEEQIRFSFYPILNHFFNIFKAQYSDYGAEVGRWAKLGRIFCHQKLFAVSSRPRFLFSTFVLFVHLLLRVE